jgi:hypothetical protein
VSPILGIIASTQQGANLPGDYESIATVTVGGGGAASVTFSSIPATYTHLQIRGISRSATVGTAGQELLLRYNGSSTNYYRFHQLYGDGSSTFSNVPAPGSLSADNAPFFTPTAGSTANAYGVAVIDILDYANTNKNKTVRSLGGFDLNGSGFVILRSGLWMDTSAVNSITLTADASGTIVQYSSFALYGIRG